MGREPDIADAADIIEVTAGALVRKRFRGELEKLKFLGHRISWHEAKFLTESNFTIRANKSIIGAIMASVAEWNKANGC